MHGIKIMVKKFFPLIFTILKSNNSFSNPNIHYFQIILIIFTFVLISICTFLLSFPLYSIFFFGINHKVIETQLFLFWAFSAFLDISKSLSRKWAPMLSSTGINSKHYKVFFCFLTLIILESIKKRKIYLIQLKITIYSSKINTTLPSS